MIIRLIIYNNYYPQSSELTEEIIYSLGEYKDSPVYAFIVNIEGTDSEGGYRNEKIFVDSSNGEVIAAYSNIMNAIPIPRPQPNPNPIDFVKAQAKDEMGDKVDFTVLRLSEERNEPRSPTGRVIYSIFCMFYFTPYWKVEAYNNTSNDSDIIIHDSNYLWNDPQQVSMYVNMCEIARWLKDRFNRNSLDGNGMKIKVVSHQKIWKDKDGNFVMDNAAWSRYDNAIFICDSSGTPDYLRSNAVAIDALTHESIHAVMQYTVGELPHANVTGAINEAYADILACVKTENWLIAEDIYTSLNKQLGGTTCDRNIENPSDARSNAAKNSRWGKCPSKVSEQFPLAAIPDLEENDYGEIHCNSMI